MNIFPVGWCETNGYQLRPPRKAIGISSVLFAVVSWVGRGGETFKSRLLQNYCRHHWIWKHSPCTENPCLVQLFPWLLGPVGIHITTPKHSRQCCLETLARCTSMWKQSISHNKEIVSVCMRTHLCYAYTFVWAVLAMVSDPWYWFYTWACASKINAITKRCWVCIYFGVEIKGTGFLNGPDGCDPLMTKCGKVNPTCFNYTSK